jgi:hypothetical protein
VLISSFCRTLKTIGRRKGEMKRYPLFLTMLILVLGVTTSALAFTFTTFDVPGSVSIAPSAINEPGQIVGFFADSREHGFVAVP